MNRLSNWLLRIIANPKPSPLDKTVRWLLWLLSKVYAVAVLVRNWAYDRQVFKSYDQQVPVISIGNLTVGGSGKTPIVIWLANQLHGQKNVAIVSRGYGKLGDGLNDEGREIAIQAPHAIQVQNPDRVQGAQTAKEELEELSNSLDPVILLDDGFQHRRLHRDVDVVVIDATNPFGYGYLLPRGLLREPRSSLYRAKIVIISRCELVDQQHLSQIKKTLLECNPKLSIYESSTKITGLANLHSESISLDSICNQKVMAFCGIGNPYAFFDSLKREGLNLTSTMIFPDHHKFNAQEMRNIYAHGSDCDAILCTQKDFVKLQLDEAEIPVYAVQIAIKIEEQDQRLDQILIQLSKLKNPR